MYERLKCVFLLALVSLIGGCENSLIDRSLIFSTHTNFGLEVSINPAEMSAPAKVQIGYQRTEGVLNPVYYNLCVLCKQKNNACECPNRKATDFYLPEAYSVLAKFTGQAQTSGGASTNTTTGTQRFDAGGNPIPGTAGTVSSNVSGGMTLSQWFATGEAAKILAQHGGASALTDNPGVAQAAAGKGTNLLDSGGDIPSVVTSLMTQLYDEIKQISDNSTPRDHQVAAEAKRIVEMLDTSALVTKVPKSFEPYLITSMKEPDSYDRASDALASKSGFDRVVVYLKSMKDSLKALEDIEDWIVTGKSVKKRGNPMAISDIDKKSILKDLATLRHEKDRWQKLLRDDPAIREMFQMLAGKQ